MISWLARAVVAEPSLLAVVLTVVCVGFALGYWRTGRLWTLSALVATGMTALVAWNLRKIVDWLGLAGDLLR